MIGLNLLAVGLLLCVAFGENEEEQNTLADFGQEQYSQQEKRYLLYDINRGEGLNLRRDVYMRVANAVRQLREHGHNYVLVLPPWGNLHHWRRQARRLFWSELFDIPSLNRFVPVMEFEDFLEENGKKIDQVLYLQPYAEGWDEKEGYQTKYDKRPCLDAYHYYALVEDSRWKGTFFTYDEVDASNLECLSIQGQSQTLAEVILKEYSKPLSILVDRAETILHDKFGDVYYWKARRSMRYAKKLVEIGDKFREEHFNSTDERDGTFLLENWEEENINKKGQPERNAVGGNFLCIHWRRADFVRSHRDHVPSIEATARQILEQMQRLNLTHLFLSSDSDPGEAEALEKQLNAVQPISVKRFLSEDEELSDAAVSIVDQWICSHARYFIGTHLSTFSFRIHEDREILGFPPETTFNRLCSDEEEAASAEKPRKDNERCEQPAKWTIVYQEEQ